MKMTLKGLRRLIAEVADAEPNYSVLDGISPRLTTIAGSLVQAAERNDMNSITMMAEELEDIADIIGTITSPGAKVDRHRSSRFVRPWRMRETIGLDVLGEIERILFDETGGQYADDDELFNNIMTRIAVEGSPEIQALPVDFIKQKFDEYIQDMEESGDWD
jgi:hypothetical protein